MSKKDEKLNRQASVNELERVLLFPDSDLESIASLLAEEVDKGLRQLGLDPNEPLPRRLLGLISGSGGNYAPRKPEEAEANKLPIKIVVVGVGGAGGSVITRMMDAGIKGVEFIAVNTDLQALHYSRAPIKVQIGSIATKGRGSGGNPDTGLQAALECTERLFEILEGADLVFLTAGLGGGTGTGALPVIASLARELGALAVAVVTKPFQFEGRRRMQVAEQGLNELRESADTVIAIPNERLLDLAGKSASLFNSFKPADEVLHRAVQAISELITVPGHINLDFADVKTIMGGMGLAWMGVGRASGEQRALKATHQAISSPLFEEATIQRAKGVLINVTGGLDLTLHEVSDASSLISQAADENANIIFGAVIDENMHDEMRITVIATGFDKEAETVEEAEGTVEQLPPDLLRNDTLSLDLPVKRAAATQRTDDFNIPTYIRRRVAK